MSITVNINEKLKFRAIDGSVGVATGNLLIPTGDFVTKWETWDADLLINGTGTGENFLFTGTQSGGDLQVGPQGVQGPIGPAGFDGAQGFQGPAGPPGEGTGTGGTQTLDQTLILGNQGTLPILLDKKPITAPSYSFSNNPNTGITSLSNNVVNMALNGLSKQQFSLNDDRVAFFDSNNLQIGGLRYVATAAEVFLQPSQTTLSATNTGWILSIARYFSTQRLVRFDTNVFQVLFADGAPSVPTFSYINDTDTGLYRIGSDALGISTNATLRLRVDNTGTNTTGTAQANNFRYTGGARKFSSSYVATIVDTEILIGNFTIDTTFSNSIVKGKVVSQSSERYSSLDFTMSLRTGSSGSTFCNISIDNKTEHSGNPNLDIRAYIQNATQTVFLVMFIQGSSVQNVGWEISMFDRNPWIFTQSTNNTVFDNTDLVPSTKIQGWTLTPTTIDSNKRISGENFLFTGTTVSGDLQVGAQGAQGSIGPAGVNGLAGTQGFQGPQGFQGIKGEDGIIGTNGTQGFQGPQGFQGTLFNGNSNVISKFTGNNQLVNSLISDNGTAVSIDTTSTNQKLNVGGSVEGNNFLFTGIQGSGDLQVGPQGPQGSIGPAGTNGLDGSQGPQGLQGLNGSNGTQGLIGPQGRQGAIGSQGAQGPRGLVGAQGFQGTVFTGLENNFAIFGNDNSLLGTTLIRKILTNSPGTVEGLSFGRLGMSNVGANAELRFGGSSSSFAGNITIKEDNVANSGLLLQHSQVLQRALFRIQSGFDSGEPLRLDFAGNLEGTNFLFTGTQGSGNLQVGAQGAQGPIGPAGTNGLAGTQGFQGIQGPIGLQGVAGTNGGLGTQGFQGNQGFQGPIGLQGIVGTQGFQGNQGNQGFQGIQGPIGIQGAQGTLFNGTLNRISKFTGNNQLGNSLISDNGTVISIDTTSTNQKLNVGGSVEGNNFLFTGTQGTGNLLVGAQGAQGSIGPAGSNGLAGAQGFQGIQGPIGLQGIAGTNGTQGFQGAQGRQGPIGLQGIVGTQGNQGFQGRQGPNSVGAQGFQGNQGFQGRQGPNSVGAQGAQGPSGPNIDTLQSVTNRGSLTSLSMDIGAGSSAAETFLNIGANKTVNSPAYIDFQSRAGSIDYDLRIIKNSGIFGIAEIRNEGGAMQIVNTSANNLVLGTGNTPRIQILGNGNVLVGGSFDNGSLLQVSGILTATNFVFG